MSRSALLFALALAATACTTLGGGSASDDDDDGGGGGLGFGGDDASGEEGGDEGGGDEGGGDEGGGDEGGGDEGGGDEGGDEGGGASACSSVFPIDSTGRVLLYDYDSSDYRGDYTITFGGKESFEGEQAWRVETESHIVGISSSYTSDYTATTWYRCDDEGIWILGQDLDQVTVTGGSEYPYWSETRYTEPGLVMPRSVSASDSWTYSYAYESLDSYGNTTEYEDAWTYRVSSATETVTVPAGTFDAWTISYEIDGSSYGYQAAEGVGTVKGYAIELVEIRD